MTCFVHCMEKSNFSITLPLSPCSCLIISNFRMIQSLRSEAAKSEDMFVQLQEVQESVRLAFLNCFLDFAGMRCYLKFMFVK